MTDSEKLAVMTACSIAFIVGMLLGCALIAESRAKTPAECRSFCDGGRFVLARLSSRGECSCADSYQHRIRVVRR